MATANYKRPEYKIWVNIRYRCGPKFIFRDRYYDRGISVCHEWKTFSNFFRDMGPRPSPLHSIDRIDNDLGYSKKNCRWATSRQQQLNTSSNVKLKLGKVEKTVTEWAEELGISRHTIYGRIRRGIPKERFLERPRKYGNKTI